MEVKLIFCIRIGIMVVYHFRWHCWNDKIRMMDHQSGFSEVVSFDWWIYDYSALQWWIVFQPECFRGDDGKLWSFGIPFLSVPVLTPRILFRLANFWHVIRPCWIAQANIKIKFPLTSWMDQREFFELAQQQKKLWVRSFAFSPLGNQFKTLSSYLIRYNELQN